MRIFIKESSKAGQTVTIINPKTKKPLQILLQSDCEANTWLNIDGSKTIQAKELEQGELLHPDLTSAPQGTFESINPYQPSESISTENRIALPVPLKLSQAFADEPTSAPISPTSMMSPPRNQAKRLTKNAGVEKQHIIPSTISSGIPDLGGSIDAKDEFSAPTAAIYNSVNTYPKTAASALSGDLEKIDDRTKMIPQSTVAQSLKTTDEHQLAQPAKILSTMTGQEVSDDPDLSAHVYILSTYGSNSITQTLEPPVTILSDSGNTEEAPTIPPSRAASTPERLVSHSVPVAVISIKGGDSSTPPESGMTSSEESPRSIPEIQYQQTEAPVEAAAVFKDGASPVRVSLENVLGPIPHPEKEGATVFEHMPEVPADSLSLPLAAYSSIRVPEPDPPLPESNARAKETNCCASTGLLAWFISSTD